MNLLVPGMYVSARSLVHHLDPRLKAGVALLLMLGPFAAPAVMSNLILSALVVAAVFLASVPVVALLSALRTVLWLALFMFVFYFFMTPGRPLFELGAIRVTFEGLLAGLTQVYRLCFMVVVSSLLTYTTSPTQVAHGLEATLGPLAVLGLPIRELAMVLTIALRFVPTLFEEIDKIVKAQEARGASIRSGGLLRRLRGWTAIFVPIFVSAFRRADELASAMEARGFRGTGRRSSMVELRFSPPDLLAALIVLVTGVGIVLVEWLA